MADKGKGIADDYSSGKRKRDADDKSGNRKRKNLSVLQFFEDAAFEESGSSDDEDFINDDINMYFEDDLGADLEVKTEPKTPNIPFFPKEEEMDEEEMDKLLEARYKPGANFVKYSEDRTEPTRFDEQNAFMPFAKDPTIWKVKCTVGRERHSVFCLMQKFVDLQLLGTKLQIVSAFAVEHVKGFIYIEAEKQCDINEACKGLCNIYPSRVSSVPLSEVPHLFSVRSKYSGVSVDTWARVKNGKYKGDLAQVVNVNEAKRKATVKLVPRIDLQAVAEKFGGGVTGKKSTIPAPRLITSSELEAYGPLVHRKQDRETNDVYEVFDGMTLKDGYLYKKVNLDSLSFWDVRPSEAELIKFSPANKEESNDVEWLTGIFGERKKKKPTISNDKTGGKGEGSSSSIENSFEVPDLVFHGRKGFGIVIGREKDDRIKVLGEGTDKPLVVVVEARLLKKADFDKKLTAFDQHKKIISTNDTVRVLEGPLEDKRGLVKHIYKGVVFLHDENESENCGYFCAKAQICEKMDFGSDLYKGKGGKSDASGFDDFPRSPKSPLSPNKPWEGRENSRNFDRDDKDGFSVGQSCRIRVGPLKGYMCRVMAIRYSDITVKLDSQHKILTVKSEHLAEVKGKSSGVSIGDGQDSAKPFELLGDNGGTQGWMDTGASESGGGGWNTGSQPTERSSWAPFPANPFNSVDNDSSKDAGASAWETKTTQDNNSTPWGASATENKSGGWGASSSGVKDDNSNDAGWGAAKLKLKEPDATPWGSAASSDNGENKSAWNSAPAPVTETGGWGSTKKDENTTGWGSTKKDENTTGWGKQTAGGSSWGKEDGGGSSWGKQAEVEKGESDGWNKKSSDSGWGNKQGSDGGSKDDVDGAGGWGKKPSVTGGESGKWASAEKDAEGGSGWGHNKDVVSSSSWSKPAGGGGSSWGNQDSGSWSKQDGGRGGANACFKCGETGHMSRECPQGGGGGGGSSRSCYKCGETGHMSRECPQGGGGGGGGGSSRNCYKCGETGHMSRECPQSGGGGGSGGGSRSCYKCGEEGHMSRECPQGGGGGGSGGGGGRSCYKCGEEGHMSRECPQGGGGGGSGGGRSCYKCGEEGHMSRECPQGGGGGGSGGGRSCYKCGEEGHMSRECPQGGGGGRNCYKCGEAGHMSRECPQGGGGGGGGGKSCYKCGESGHMSRECPQGAGGAGGGGGRSCYKCGESGHMSRECPQGGGGGGGSRSCYKCGETGHMSRECPQGGGGGGGGGGGSRNCYKCGEAGHMSRECPQGGDGGGSYGGGGGWSSGGWGSNKASEKKEDGQSSGGGWSSGGWGSNKASDAGAGKKDDGQSSGWSSTGGWSGNAGAGKKDDANGSQLGSSGWGSDAGKKPDAQASGWGGEQTGKKEGWGSLDQAGGWGGSSKEDPAKKDDAEESGWKKSGW